MRTFILTSAVMSAAILTFAAPASSAEGTVEACLKQYGGHELPVFPGTLAKISPICTPFVFPPMPQTQNGRYQFGGNEVRNVALSCRDRHNARPYLQLAEACATFFLFDENGEVGTIMVPPKESGGLY